LVLKVFNNKELQHDATDRLFKIKPLKVLLTQIKKDICDEDQLFMNM
jgi:hypothetical protein